MSRTKRILYLFIDDHRRIHICSQNTYICSMSLGMGNAREQGLEDARRITALWNAAEDLDLDTEQIERGIIEHAFVALKEKVEVME